MLLVTGDVHGTYDIDKLNRPAEMLAGQAQEENVLLIAGDFGGIWRQSYAAGEVHSKDLRNINQVYGMKPWITCWVDGNHENHDIINEMPVYEKWGGRVHMVTPFCFHLMRGEVYTIQGVKILAMGGAYSVDKMYRREGISWWEAETITEVDVENARKNLTKHDNKVDIVLSHTCPAHMLGAFEAQLPPWDSGYWGPKRTDPSCAFLDEATRDVEYKNWYFGHYHSDLDEKVGDKSYYMLYNRVMEVEI